ncbi:hypothetical protein P6U16_25225 (plasmid) [Rhizobium sp. 32-5/1]|uniref:hypothetical protein n=1 Tax=Rhizobium sp. 32-5/1 TaxID=3019602 RepID=UPI00240E0E1E|nr:hypothetical protein [Rhizobium sp. 32-5/1]WEZ85406.1 hypothetical protein P6U16_25225 [Rhizobium sp. 32-5/1]
MAADINKLLIFLPPPSFRRGIFFAAQARLEHRTFVSADLVFEAIRHGQAWWEM